MQKLPLKKILPNFNGTRTTLIKEASEKLREKFLALDENFNAYDPGKTTYHVNGSNILLHENELEKFLDNPANSGKQVFAQLQKKFDLSLEGGGSFGFAHIGVVHAFALKGIGFDRISGTSAGSIAGALLAAGYEIDLNYTIKTEANITDRLVASNNNSINKILFEDLYESLSDMSTNRSEIRDLVTNSWFIKALKAAVVDFTESELITKAEIIKLNILMIEGALGDVIIKTIAELPFGLQLLDFRLPGLPFAPPNPSTREVIRGAIGGIAEIFETPINAIKNFVKDAIRKIMEVVGAILTDATVNWIFSKNEVRADRLGIFRLLELGGLWEGLYIRDWIETHLQAKVKGTGVLLDGRLDGKLPRPKIREGNSYKRAVLFRDLPIDFCVVAAAIGTTGNEFDARKTDIVYFSKKLSPDYPVAEAVRRSMSLPFVFVPRTLQEGYGFGVDIRKPVVDSSMIFHGNELCLDGGFFVNSPLAVFRDLDNIVFNCPRNTSNHFTKTLVISNINSMEDASTRPFDIPFPVMPEPIKSLIKTGFQLKKILLPKENHEILTPSTGLDKLKLAIGTVINSTPIGDWKEYEIDLLLPLVENSILVEIKTLDPFHLDKRLDSSEFAMSLTTKKWLLYNGFEGANRALADISENMENLREKLSLVQDNPYQHLLQLSGLNIAPENYSIKPDPSIIIGSGSTANDFPAKIGDAVFHRSNIKVNAVFFRAQPNLPYLDFGLMQLDNDIKVFVGHGYSWLKVINNDANKTNAHLQWLSFNVNIRCEVVVLLDKTPPFTNALGWQPASFTIKLSNGVLLHAFTKKFPAGSIIIPGPRYGGNPNNTVPLGILIRPL